ncbi:Leucine-rich repeat and calponin homology domain-containing protein 1 (Fragment) [Geodia barretti]|uniref:Leucine-rich repeat and calponin homology domain-containing protein 1 n=1 Tax=Geodia barretti TaxID=519541 RepID=A0AA35XFV0_GEOBA
MTDNPIESPPTHVCVRGLMHIVKWMEGLEKHGSDPHLLSISRDASLARRKGKRHSTSSRSFIDNSQPAGENGVLNLDEVTNRINSSLRVVESPSLLAKNDPGSAMSDQSKEEYREAAHKLYMQQERQKNRINRRKRSSSPIQATAKAAVTLSKQQSGSTELSSIPMQRGSKEDILAAAGSPTGGTKSLGGSPRVAPARSLAGEKNPRPGSWNSHTKVSSSPILPSKYAMPASEKQTSEDEASSKGGVRVSEVEVKKKPPPPPPPQNKPDSGMVQRRHESSEEAKTRAALEETHRKPPPQETVGATPTSSLSRETTQQQQHLGSGLNRRERSPAPHFDRSDSVTPTNELVDEESVTPRSKEVVKDAGITLAAASQKLEEELLSARQSGSVEEDGRTTTGSEKPAPNGVAGGGTKTEKKPAVVKGQEEEGKKKKKEECRQSLQEGDMVQTLDSSLKMRRTHSSESEASDGACKKDTTWQRALPPRRKKEKDVFKFLKEENSSNYTVRRQEFQISRVMEKSRIVREKIEELLEIELSEDIGEWVADGVVLCKLVKKLHPQLMPSFHSPPLGKDLSRGRKTVNIANFIAACRQLHVPEEELCSAGDIIELKDPVRVVTCLQRVLESANIMVMSP